MKMLHTWELERYEPTVEWAEDVKQACIELIEKRYKKNEFMYCPFCKIKDKYDCVNKEEKENDACPWLVWTEHTCMGLGLNGIKDPTKNHSNCTNEQNIARLEDWIERCDKIIKEVKNEYASYLGVGEI